MNQKATPDNSKPLLTLDSAACSELIAQYTEVVGTIAGKIGLAKADVVISGKALSLALPEAKKDLDIMGLRRSPGNGISPSKIAGIVAFRLSRFRPVHLAAQAAENEIALKINDLSALVVAMKSVLGKDVGTIASSHASKELQYTMARRHMNQETLGLAFELLS